MIPQWILSITVNGKLKKYCQQMAKIIDPEIESYRVNPEKSESRLIRVGIDDGLTNYEIAEIIICLMYVASENTSMLLHAAIVDLARKPELWRELKAELFGGVNDTSLSKPKAELFVSGNDVDIFKSELLESVILESARLNSHIFAIARSPNPDTKTLGGFNIEKSDQVVMCELIMMVLGDNVPYTEPKTYNPKRFMSPMFEPKTATDILSWGALVHQCPGKNFALNENKAAVALMIKAFEPFEVTYYGEPDYFSTASFVDRKVIVNMKLS